MLAHLRRRLSYANVMSTIAVFAALGGGAAYAADTVFSSDIKDLEVKNQDLAFDAVTSSKIKDNAIQSSDINDFTITANDFNINTIGSSKILNDSLTGDDVLETSLNALQFGKVQSAIDADKLGGKTPDAYLGSDMVLPPGKTLRGAFSEDSFADHLGDRMDVDVSYGFVADWDYGILLDPGQSSVECPGSAQNPTAEPGVLCLYEAARENSESTFVSTVLNSGGVTLQYMPIALGNFGVEGGWAVTGGEAALPSRRAQRKTIRRVSR